MATVHLIARGGSQAAALRAIAKELGVSEAAIYRYFRSKDEVEWEAYASIVESMAEEKRELAADTERPVRARLHEWIALTYRYFDLYPEAFAYVLLLPPPPAARGKPILSSQSKLFAQMIGHARARGEVRAIATDLAVSHFTGLVLNIPRLIREGALTGPATKYVDEVARAVWAVLGPDPQPREDAPLRSS